MNIITKLANLEREISEYADAAGKDVEAVFDDIKQFLVTKKVELENAKASTASKTN